MKKQTLVGAVIGVLTAGIMVGGATIALALIMLNSKEPGYRKVSRLSLPTQIFQINEPIFFGFPIVLNPIFMIPYILNALILTGGHNIANTLNSHFMARNSRHTALFCPAAIPVHDNGNMFW